MIIFNVLVHFSGALALFSGFFVYAFKKRSHILICKSTSDLLWMINYFIQEKYSAGGVSFVCVCRGIIFYNNIKLSRTLKVFLLYLFMLLTVAVSVVPVILGDESLIALLPMLGSIIAVYAFYQTNALKIRKLGILSSFPWLIYSLLIQNWFSAINSAIQILIGLFKLIYDYNND